MEPCGKAPLVPLLSKQTDETAPSSKLFCTPNTADALPRDRGDGSVGTALHAHSLQGWVSGPVPLRAPPGQHRQGHAWPPAGPRLLGALPQPAGCPSSSHPVPIKPGITDGTATGPIKRTAGMRPPRPLGARYQKHQ